MVYINFGRILFQPGIKDLDIPGYLKYRMLDSPGNNIGFRPELIGNKTTLMQYCNSMKNCQGFNQQSWIKDKISPRKAWKIVPDSEFWLYVKNT